jgi:hypothetical protein
LIEPGQVAALTRALARLVLSTSSVHCRPATSRQIRPLSLFWLAYHRPETSRLAGVVLIDSSDLLHARLYADLAGQGVGCAFAEGHALDEAWRRHVTAGMIGRLLSPDEARGLLERIERADPTPKRPPAPSTGRRLRAAGLRAGSSR